MAVQIGAKPDSGFDDPIGMLTDCHRRIEQFLEILVVVAHRAQRRALNDEESAAVRSALDYFRIGGQRHTADEEQSLFPRLREAAGTAIPEDIAGLECDHNVANDLHERVETLFKSWLNGSTLGRDDQDALLAATERLARLYNEHIRLEEQVVFPRAAQVLDKNTLASIGEEFRARRSVRQ